MRFFFLTLLAFILTMSSAQAQQSSLIKHRADSLVSMYHSSDGPGLSVVVSREGEIVYSAQGGMANLEYDIPITDSTVFHIASVSKQFTVLAAMLLEQEGKLSLDDDISRYLPELRDLPHKISLRNLTNHTHGLPNIHELAQVLGVGQQEVLRQSEIVRILLRLKGGNFVPGTKYQYNNTGFCLLAEIIERVSEQSFSAYMEERVFEPLGMHRTRVLDDLVTVIDSKAYSYGQVEDTHVKVPFNFSVYGSSGINTTAEDLSRWARNFDNPIVGDNEMFIRMTTPGQLSDGEQLSYALGLEVKDYRGLSVVFHGGGDAGYRSYLLRVPAYDFSVVVLGNFEAFNPLRISYDLLDLYLGEYMDHEEPKKAPVYTSADLAAWVGDYEMFPGTLFSLRANADTLCYQPFSTELLYPLPCLDSATFSFPYANHSYIEFTGSGMDWHFSDFAYPCEKVVIQLPDPADIELEDYEGLYWNEELRTSYVLDLKDGVLTASHVLNSDIALNPLAKDEFYSDRSFFGKLRFERNANSKVTEFVLSGQNLEGLVFKRVE